MRRACVCGIYLLHVSHICGVYYCYCPRESKEGKSKNIKCTPPLTFPPPPFTPDIFPLPHFPQPQIIPMPAFEKSRILHYKVILFAKTLKD